MAAPFGGRLLVLFSLPLAIWVLVSLASLILVQHASRVYEQIEMRQGAITLANEFRATLDMLRNEERVYIASSSPAALDRRSELMRRASGLYARLEGLRNESESQDAALELAGNRLRRWYYEVSEQRIAAHDAGRPIESDVRGPEYAGEFHRAMAAFIDGETARLRTLKVEIAGIGRFIYATIISGLALSATSIVVVIAWLGRLMATSVDSLNVATQEIARGNMSARVTELGLNNDLARRFNLMAVLIEQRNRELMVLAELGGLMNSCTNTREIVDVFSSYADRLFPDRSGALYFVGANRFELALAASWQGGEHHTLEHMGMDACWASRLGRAHRSHSDGTRCAHLLDDVDACCLPLSAFGELVGILTIVGALREEQRSGKQVSGMVAQQLALTFANVRLRELLRDQAVRDPLTHLFSRRHLDETLRLELYRARRHRTPLGVLVLDIDHFRQVNDSFGRDAGDALLRAVAQELARFFRPEDRLFRSGGEKFTVLLPATARPDAVHRAETLRESMAKLRATHDGADLSPITVSVGVAAFPDDARDGALLLKAANAALCRAKKAGRNRVTAAGDGAERNGSPS